VLARGKSSLVMVTDGSFEGLLSAVFYAYAHRMYPDEIRGRNGRQVGLFEKQIDIAVDTAKSDRVWRGLRRHLGRPACKQIYLAHLSGAKGVDTLIYHQIRYSVPAKGERPGRPSSRS